MLSGASVASSLHTNDYDTLYNTGVGHSTGSLSARIFNLSEGTIAVPMHGGQALADSVVKTGGGSVLLSADNDFQGNVKVTLGTFTLSGTNQFGGTLTVDAGDVYLNGANTGVAAIAVNALVAGTQLHVGHSGALGDVAVGRGTTIAVGAQLLLEPVTASRQPWNHAGTRSFDLDIAEELTVGGAYLNVANSVASSAIYSTEGINRLSGAITLSANTTIATYFDDNRAGALNNKPALVTSTTGTKLYLTGPITGVNKDLTLRVANGGYDLNNGNNDIPYNPGQIELGGVLDLGTGKLIIDGLRPVTVEASYVPQGKGVVALLKGNNYSGGTTIGVADTNTAAPSGSDQNDNGHAVDVVVGAATAFGQGKVDLVYGNIYAAADIDLGANIFTQGFSNVSSQGVGNVYSGEDIRNASKKNSSADTLQTNDYDTLFNTGVGHSTGSIKAGFYDLHSGTIAVPMHGGRTSGQDSVVKSESGTVVLGGNNDFTGVVKVTDGVLKISTQLGLGLGAGAGNHTVISNGTLQLGGVMTNLAENFTLSGTGYAGAATINNVGGAARMTGSIDLTANAIITNTAATGTLTIDAATAITGGYNLTLTGSSPITLNRSLNTGVGSLIKTGTSTATITADSTYAGTTTVNTTDTTAGKGRLIINSILSGGGLATVNANAVIGGTGSIAGSVVLNQGATGTSLTKIEAGVVGGQRSSGTGNFSIGGSLTINGTAQISLLSSNQ